MYRSKRIHVNMSENYRKFFEIWFINVAYANVNSFDFTIDIQNKKI